MMINKICQTCGKEFKVFNCRSSAKYCCMRCYNKHGENNPKWRGGIINKHEGGYIQIHSPKHPYTCKHGKYVYEHRLVMEKFIGRFLTPNEIVHHINGNTSDNRIDNLELLSGQKEHARIHYKANKKTGRFESNYELK